MPPLPQTYGAPRPRQAGREGKVLAAKSITTNVDRAQPARSPIHRRGGKDTIHTDIAGIDSAGNCPALRRLETREAKERRLNKLPGAEQTCNLTTGPFRPNCDC